MNSTVIKAFEIINYISEKQGEVRLVDITNDLDMNKTTAFRFLETLESLNIIEKKSNTYYLGLSLLQLGNKVITRTLLLEKIIPILERISDDVNETVNFAQLQGDMALYLHKIDSKRSLQFSLGTGDRLPLYCTAMGKAILSALPDDKYENIVQNIDFRKITPNTIDNKESLYSEIKSIRAQGFSTEEEELEEGLICISVPITIRMLDFRGAISISGPAFRISEDTINRLVKRLKTAQSEIINLF
ncbi:MAG: IclR family transcriptional regulator [Rhodothermaceae bacterium]